MPEIVPASVLNERTRLVLVNAVYFKGDWKHKFDARATIEDDFHVSKDKTARVLMMYLKEDFYYAVNNDIKCQVTIIFCQCLDQSYNNSVTWN